MASRLFSSSRSSKSTKMTAPDASDRPSVPPKRSAIPLPPTSRTSPSPALQPSLLPRGTAKSDKALPRAPAVGSRSLALQRAPSTSKAPAKKAAPTAPSSSKASTSGIRPPAVTSAASKVDTASTPSNIPPPRARLRRKASSGDQRSQYAQAAPSQPARDQRSPASVIQNLEYGHADPHPGTLLGIGRSDPVQHALAQPVRPDLATSAAEATSNSRMNLYNARQQLPKLRTPDPPPISTGRSSTPSTRFSESPGNFSRGSTPTSASSHSPSLVQTPKFGPRIRPSISPAQSRPPVTRRKIGGAGHPEDATEDHGLPAVRESLVSSASSPVTGPDAADSEDRVETDSTKKTKRSMPPPTPPLRLSSKRASYSRLLPPATTVTSPASMATTLTPASNLPVTTMPTTTIASASAPPRVPLTAVRHVAASNSTSAPDSTASNRQNPPVSLPLPPSHAARAIAQPAVSRIGRPTTAHNRLSGLVQPKSASSAERPSMPPPRPSRDGLQPLDTNISPVIQSSLTQLSAPGRFQRDPTSDTGPPNSAPASVSASARPSLSRSPSVTSASSQRGMTATAAASSTSPHLHSREQIKIRPPLSKSVDLTAGPGKRDPSPITSTSSQSPSRFGLFGRRLKSPSETSIASPPQTKPQKLTKKGPAAGTGHEGYGRYARRGRSTSIGTTGTRNPSTSTDRGSITLPARPSRSRKSSFNSSDDTTELDEFYRDRLEPITIGGGGQVRENRNSKILLYQSASGQNSVGSLESGKYATCPSQQGASSVDLNSLASSENNSRELLPAPRLISTPQGIIQQERTIAHRRSLHRSQLSGDLSSTKVPPPINTRMAAPSPAIETYDSTVSSAILTESSMVSEFSEGQEGNWLRSKKKAATPKVKTTRKWNFFRRAQRSPEKTISQPSDSFELDRTMQAQVSNAPGYGPVAHYTIMDEADSGSEQDLEERLRDIEGHLEFQAEDELPIEKEVREREPSMLLPPPPSFAAQFEEHTRSISPRVPLNQGNGRDVGYVGRQPRLKQVGRIPQVISKRDRQHNPATHSFSRPFPGRPSFDEPLEAPMSAELPTLGLQTTDLPRAEWPQYSQPASAPVLPTYPFPDPPYQEFLRLSPRKDSELTSGSSSSGAMNLAPVTAITPTAEDVLSDDEIWNEYDDLLDRVSPPILTESPAISEMMANYAVLTATRSPPADYMNVPLTFRPGHLGPMSVPLANIMPDLDMIGASTAKLMPPPTHSLAGNDLSSPISLSDLYSTYGHRSSAVPTNPRLSQLSATSGSRYSSQTNISKSGSRSSVESPDAKRVTQVMAEKTSIASSDSLRFAALMTSRWLSFDRVLFSPAQADICTARQSRVLVLDGLANDDWAAYCALTYPDATVYYLSATHRSLQSCETHSGSESWVPPSNLRRVSHAGLASPFPFPRGFFAAVVLRFPIADTSGAYRNAISESKRVLKPGGFLELSILDIDMVNMGHVARRAIRSVKERMQARQPDVSLGPASDTVLKLLGRRGFENINRCVVGVPLGGSSDDIGSAAVTPIDEDDDDVRASKRSLQDFLDAPKAERLDPQRSGTRMIGPVARWWWSRCYERPAGLGLNESDGDPADTPASLPGAAASVWSDTVLLQECAERQTSLRLIICYAQKPESVRRRTVSV